MSEHPDVLTVERIAPPSPAHLTEYKISAALLGGAIADAMGWVTEFIKSPKELQAKLGVSRMTDFMSWEKKTGGRFNPYVDYVGLGEYSDDTQLVLCVARSIRPNGRVDNEYFSKVELPAWLTYARGAGATITAAARSLTRRSVSWNQNFFRFHRGKQDLDYRGAGANGAAMRISPIAMANYHDSDVITNEVWRNAIVTHGHPRAIVGALVYAHALAYILARSEFNSNELLQRVLEVTERITPPEQDADIAAWLEEWQRGTSQRFLDVLSRTKEEMVDVLQHLMSDGSTKLQELYARFGCFFPATKGSAIGTVGAALATFLRHGSNFQYVVLEAVNMLGADTDTIASMAGSLSAAHAGYDAIPEQWSMQTQDFSYFMRVASALARVAERKAEGPELIRDGTRFTDARTPQVMILPGVPRLARNMRVQHPIFGIGTVRDIEVQRLSGRRNGSILFISVLFDSGQACKFKFYRPQPIKATVRSVRREEKQGKLFS